MLLLYINLNMVSLRLYQDKLCFYYNTIEEYLEDMGNILLSFAEPSGSVPVVPF